MIFEAPSHTLITHFLGVHEIMNRPVQFLLRKTVQDCWKIGSTLLEDRFHGCCIQDRRCILYTENQWKIGIKQRAQRCNRRLRSTSLPRCQFRSFLATVPIPWFRRRSLRTCERPESDKSGQRIWGTLRGPGWEWSPLSTARISNIRRTSPNIISRSPGGRAVAPTEWRRPTLARCTNEGARVVIRGPNWWSGDCTRFLCWVRCMYLSWGPTCARRRATWCKWRKRSTFLREFWFHCWSELPPSPPWRSRITELTFCLMLSTLLG